MLDSLNFGICSQYIKIGILQTLSTQIVNLEGKKGNDGKLEINITQSNKVSIASSVAEQSIEHIFSNINMYNLTKALNHYMCSIILNLFKVTKGNNGADFNLELTSSMRRINNKW